MFDFSAWKLKLEFDPKNTKECVVRDRYTKNLSVQRSAGEKGPILQDGIKSHDFGFYAAFSQLSQQQSEHRMCSLLESSM